MALADNLAAYWKLDESAGATTAADSLGNSNLTKAGSATFAAGKINNGTDLESSTSDYWYRADNTALSITGDITIAMWIKIEQLPSTAEAYMGLFNKARADGNLSYAFYLIDDDRLYFSYWLNGTSDGNNTAGHINNFVVSGDVGNWVHVAVSVDVSAQSITFYKNGTGLTTDVDVQSATSIFDGNANGVLGAGYWGGTYEQFFDGIIDEVGIWSKALSSAEIGQLYNSGNGFTYPFTTSNFFQLF